MTQTQVFSWECYEFFKNSFFYRTPLVAAFNKERGKNFQMKEENENISFKFYLQLLNIRTAHPFSLTSSNFLFFWFLDVGFLCFRILQIEKYLLAFISIFRSRHWELFCQTAVWQDRTKIVNFFLQNWS